MQLLLRVMQVLELMVHVLVALQLTLCAVLLQLQLLHFLLAQLLRQLRLLITMMMVHPMLLSCSAEPSLKLSSIQQLTALRGTVRIIRLIRFLFQLLKPLSAGCSC